MGGGCPLAHEPLPHLDDLQQGGLHVLIHVTLSSTKKVCPINCNYFLVLSVSILQVWKDGEVRLSTFMFSNTWRLVTMLPSGLMLLNSSSIKALLLYGDNKPPDAKFHSKTIV